MSASLAPPFPPPSSASRVESGRSSRIGLMGLCYAAARHECASVGNGVSSGSRWGGWFWVSGVSGWQGSCGKGNIQLKDASH